MQDASTFPSAPNELATCQQMIRELLTTVGQLRTTIDKQNLHIHYLVRMTFSRRSERVEGTPLFDALPAPEPAPRASASSTTVRPLPARLRRLATGCARRCGQLAEIQGAWLIAPA